MTIEKNKTVALGEKGELFPNRTCVLLEPNPNAKLNEGGLNPVIVFSGVTATGKDLLAEQLKASGMDVSLIGFGNLLSEALSVQKNKLANFKPEDLEGYYPEIVNVALENSPTLLTAHPVYRQGGTLCFTPGIYTAMDPLAFVVITSEEDQINKWRKERQEKTGRKSNQESKNDIRLMQNVTQAIIYTFARSNGAGLITVRNTVADTTENVRFLNSTLTKWLETFSNNNG